MDKDKIFSFYEKMYFESLSEMNVVLSRFPILIAGVALIINAYIFLFNFADFKGLLSADKFLVLFLISGAMIRLLYCMFKTFKAKRYALMPDLQKLSDYQDEMVEYCRELAFFNKKYPDHAQEVPDIDLTVLGDIKDLFVKCSAANSESSLERGEWFHKSMFWIWINLCMCITIPILIIVITI